MVRWGLLCKRPFGLHAAEYFFHGRYPTSISDRQLVIVFKKTACNSLKVLLH